jgi:hypothetical protein
MFFLTVLRQRQPAVALDRPGAQGSRGEHLGSLSSILESSHGFPGSAPRTVGVVRWAEDEETLTWAETGSLSREQYCQSLPLPGPRSVSVKNAPGLAYLGDGRVEYCSRDKDRLGLAWSCCDFVLIIATFTVHADDFFWATKT